MRRGGGDNPRLDAGPGGGGGIWDCLLYSAALERIATGGKAPLAPAGTALMLYLAGQCLSGLL